MKKAFKIPLAGLSFVVFLITLILYIYFFTSVPEQRLNDWFSYYLTDKIGYKITVENINRNLWKKIKLEGIKIFFVADDKSTTVEVGNIKSIEVDYSFKDILFQNYSFSKVMVVDLNLSILPDVTPSGLFSSGEMKKSSEKQKLPVVNINRFEFANINLKTLFDDDIINIGINELLGSVRSDGEFVKVNFESLTGYCPEKDFGIESFNGNISFSDNNLVIESLNLKTGRSDITILGRVDRLNNPDLNLTFNFAPLNLKDIETISGIKLVGEFQANGNIKGGFDRFSGKLEGDGIIFERDLNDFSTEYRFDSNILTLKDFKGSVFKAPMAGDGFINFATKPETFGFEGDVSGFNLQNLGVDLYSLFTGRIDLKGDGFNEESFHMNIDMDLSKADVDIYHLHQAEGKIDFDLNYLIFQPGFKAYYKKTMVTLEGILEYTGLIDISGDVVFDNLADFTDQIFISDLDGIGKADFSVTGLTEDFTIAGNFNSDSCRFFGLVMDSLDFEIELKSFISHQVGSISGNWKGGDLYSVPVDSGYFSVLVSGERYFLDKIYWENKNNIMSFSGSFDNSSIPPSLVVDTLSVILWNDTIENVSPLVVDVFEKEVEFADFKLCSNTSNLSIAGTVTYESEMNLNINAVDLEIKPILNYFIPDRVISGILSGNVKTKGDFDFPEFETDISIEDLAMTGLIRSNQVVKEEDFVALGNFDFKAEYSDSEIRLLTAELQSPRAEYALSGTLPVNLSFTSDEKRLLNRPINARLIASGESIVLVPVFVPNVANFDADFNVDIAISGTYDTPHVDGDFTLSKGTLKAVELVNPLTGVNVNGRMENDIIYVDRLVGVMRSSDESLVKKINDYVSGQIFYEEDPGVISGSGTIKLLGLGLFEYDLSLSGSDCEFYTDGYDIQGLADIYLTITGSSPPLVSGWTQIQRLEMKESFATFSTGVTEESEVLEDSTIWDIKIDISATNNLWIKNTDADMAFEGAADMELKGDVLVNREKGIYNTLGQLDIIRGNFYLGNLKFELNKGEMIFNNIADIDPQINYEVTTRVRDSSNPGQHTDFDLVISGTLTNPEIQTAEGSGYSNDDIMRILVASTVPAGDNILSDASLYLLQLYNPIERIGVIDEFDINPYDQEGGVKMTRISVAKYISPKLFLRYSRRLSQEESKQTFGVEYFFNDNISFEGKQGTKDEGVSLDLKFRYEF